MPRPNRRDFLKSSALAGAGFWISGSTASAKNRSANDKLNIAVIGCGGRGHGDLMGVAGENIVALCDVDERRAAQAFGKFPKAKKYRDYRRLLDRQKDIDAVVVATPDHHHTPASLMAMNLGKHVYCEKPLTHSVYEARVMRETAKRTGVATQMGIQGHALDGQRATGEFIQAGRLGPVRQVHIWTDRPGSFWRQAIERPAETPLVPDTLAWDLWLGPAPKRPYHAAYVPFKWRGWWDFGTGALGDMGCHCIDLAYWALKLDAPSSVAAESSGNYPETGPAWSIIRYQFAKRGELPSVELTWYDGGKKPPADLVPGQELAGNGLILVGDEGAMLCTDPYGAQYKLFPADEFADVKLPDPSLPRVGGGHHQEWIDACKGGPPARADFAYSGRLTEMVLLGNVALRLGQRIQWDAANLRVTNSSEAEPLIRREYRSGWDV